MAAEDLYDVTPIPAIDPQGMGLGPAPMAPQAPMLAPSGNPHQKIQDLIALAVSVLGGHQTTGFGTGMLNENRRLEQDRTQKNAIAQHQYQLQQTDYEQQQRLYQGEQDKRSQILQQNIQSLRRTVPTLKSQAQYDQFVETYANGLKGMGYRGVDANFLRSAAPYVAPTAQQRASKALDDVLSSPLTKAALTSNPDRVLGGKVQFDANGDGVPEDYYVHELAALAGRPIVKDDQGQPIIPDAKEGKVGTAFQEALTAKVATFKAVNRRDPSPQEKQKLVSDAIEQTKEKPPGQAPRDRFNVQPITNADGSQGLIRVNLDSGEVAPVAIPNGAGAGKASDTQRLSSAYLDRTVASDQSAVKFEKNLLSLGGQIDVKLPNMLKSEGGQRYRQAKDEFINASLRRESGAAIQPSEYDRYDAIYFAQPGDTAATLKQKQEARARVIKGFRTTAGPMGGGAEPKPADGAVEQWIRDPATGKMIRQGAQ